jgi:hypothetical protein
MWPSQLILCPFIHFTIFSPLLNSSSSRFVLLFYSPSSYLGPYIFRNIFLSKIRRAFFPFFIIVHVSAPHVTAGLISVLYSRILVGLDKRTGIYARPRRATVNKNCFSTFFLWLCDPMRVMASSFLRFLDHTQRRTTVGRTPLDEWPARRRDLYLTTHNTHNRQTSMPPVEFEPTISAGERPQTYALDRAATRTGEQTLLLIQIFMK